MATEEATQQSTLAVDTTLQQADGLEPSVDENMQMAVARVVALSEKNSADEAAELLRRECSQAPVPLLTDAAQAVVESYLRTQQHASATEVLRFMCANGAVPSDSVFNSVVDAAVRAKAHTEAWDSLELLLKHQRRADKYFVSILTKSLESSHDRKWVRRGIALVENFIEQQKEDVDEIVFNSLLNVVGQMGDMLKLQQTLERMAQYNVPPSAITYGTVVKAYGRARDIDAVLKVWHEMRNRCLGINPVTCGCVLDACVKCGHLDKATAIFQEMKLQGLHKNTVLYATLIKGLAKTRDLMGAVHLYQEMRVEGVPCNLVTFNSLMDVCVRCENLPTAAVFLQDMMSMGIDPDLITFSTLIKGYSQTGEVHKALALSRELKSRGLRCDEIMYNSLIDGCAKANRLQDGLAVFNDMLQSHVAPSNITFSILVKLYFEAGHVDAAFYLVEEMGAKYRCAPGRIVYTVLFRCCAQKGGMAIKKAVALLSELASKRNSKLMDQSMVSAVLCGCAQHFEFELASIVINELTTGSNAKRGNHTLLPHEALRTVLEACGAYDETRGVEIVENLRRASYPGLSIGQLQQAMADGRRKASTGEMYMPSVQQPIVPNSADAYSQWQGANAFAPQPYNIDYQQLQMVLNAGYPQMPMPTMPTMPPAMQPTMPMYQPAVMQPTAPMMPTTMQQMPMMPTTMQTSQPGFFSPPLAQGAATAAPPAPAAPVRNNGAGRNGTRRTRQVKDKENSAPTVQRTKGATEVQKQPYGNSIESEAAALGA